MPLYNETQLCVDNPSCGGYDIYVCNNTTDVNVRQPPDNVTCVIYSFHKSSSSKVKVSWSTKLLITILFLSALVSAQLLSDDGIVRDEPDLVMIGNVTYDSVPVSYYRVKSNWVNDTLLSNKSISDGVYLSVDLPKAYVFGGEIHQKLLKRPDGGSDGFTEYEVYDHGTWWSAWKRVGSCVYDQLGQGATYSIQYTETWTYDISGGLGIEIIKSIISAELNIGVSESWSVSSSVTCNINAATSVLCLWAQHEYLWSDSHSRFCTSIPPITCTSWEEDTHADTPMNDFSARNYGCSVGTSNCQTC
ncbi:hypothetical protein V1511DRAFT_492628 [Dipodascopsis uninucleata]